MTTLASNPRRLGAEIGFLAVLHTWGQALTHHPHVHCVVPGGGALAPTERAWIVGAAELLPRRQAALPGCSAACFSSACRRPSTPECLGFFGDLAHLADPAAFAMPWTAMRRADWVVYAKKPFGGPAQVLAYLGRYTHRVAIANSRLVALDDDHVAFSWKDYRQNGAAKVMRLKPNEFIRRFLLHALPDGFHRIRHFGFMANGHRAAKARFVPFALSPIKQPDPNCRQERRRPHKRMAINTPRCPAQCGGVMRDRIERMPLLSPSPAPEASPFRCDTS